MARTKKEAVEPQDVVIEPTAPARLYRVFYKELTSTGRNGSDASQVFGTQEDAEVFAAKVDGRVV